MSLVKRTIMLSCFASLLVLVGGVAPAVAQTPWWRLESMSRPTYLPSEGEGQVVVTATNRGEVAVDGESEPVKIVDTLPATLKAKSIEAIAGSAPGSSENRGAVKCVIATVSCEFDGTLPPYDQIEVRITVNVQASAVSGESNEARVSGGETPSESVAVPLSVSEEATPFGVQQASVDLEETEGSEATQAGSHPYQVTGNVSLNEGQTSGHGAGYQAEPAALPKTLNTLLPPGLVGNPTPFPRCTLGEFMTETEGDYADECPARAAVGVATVTYSQPGGAEVGLRIGVVPIFNLEPESGEPARFGFVVAGHFPVTLDTSVRTGGDYGVTIGSNNITQAGALDSVSLSFWGVPGDSRHDSSRGWSCLRQARGEKTETPCVNDDERSPPPLISLPTSCTGPLQASVQAASWLEPANVSTVAVAPMPALDGCNRLQFSPSVQVTPDGTAGSTPTGLNVDVHVPQDSILVTNGLAESNVQGISVTLPEGVALNPAGADGLQACSESQVGFTGVDPSSGQDLFTAGFPEPFCPGASKVGTVRIKTPLLPNPLEGAVYLASQDANPFGSLVAMYIVAQDPVSGTLIKLSGEVGLSPSGRITGAFAHDPQLAFEDAELHFFGGERAPLATPAHCGTYTTNASFVPWSGNPSTSASSNIQISAGPNGAPCPGAGLPFSPSLTGGMTSIQAGGFSPFTMTMSREDGQQSLQAVTLHMPPGISGLLSSVKLCGEAQANSGTCGPESEIGETIVGVGLGGDPYSVKGGKVFITEGYEGAPYGLSIVNPAKAGPFDLGQVVVRAKIEVNPITAALTVTSDSTGPYKIPTILDGIPLQIKHVNVTIDRPGFTFNPTNCNPMSIAGSISSAEGAISSVSVPLQVTNCAVLRFKPGFTVSASGKTSKADGASLHVKVEPPAEGPQNAISGSNGSSAASSGSDKPEEANIKTVKVELPEQLPSRLTTLQKACTAQQFNSNPAGCPSASMVGTAIARTPILNYPLTGPAYFVSHGSEAFPQLIIVLQGENGLVVDLVGDTFISKAGITSSTFASVPDVPVSSFELTLPTGKYSALAANAPLCAQPLSMPTEFTGQNGAVLKQDTPIEVEGCSNTISFSSHRIKGRTLTVSVYAPAAGKLSIGAKGLKSVTKTAKRRETITFKLTQKRAGRLKTSVRATFTPTKGGRQTKSVTVRFAK